MSEIKGYNDLFGKIDSLQGVEKQRFTKTLTADEKRHYIEYCKEKDCHMVEGIFRCMEPMGGHLEMTGMAYNGETPKKYTFYDGEKYVIPLYIAKRLENEFQGLGTWYPTHTHILDQMGRPILGNSKKNRRFGFSSTSYQTVAA